MCFPKFSPLRQLYIIYQEMLNHHLKYLHHGVRRSRRCQFLTSQAGFSFIFYCLCVASRKFSYCYMCSRHYLNQINYKIVNIVKTYGILSSSAIKVYQNNYYVLDWLEVSVETKLFGHLFQNTSFPLHSSDISYLVNLCLALSFITFNKSSKWCKKL